MAYKYKGTDYSIPDYLSDPLPSKCGTRAGYRKHQNDGEPPCDDCNKAHAEYMRQYMAGYTPPVAHGTMSGYRAHRRVNEPPCDECREANAEYMRDYKERRKARQIRTGWTPEKCGTIAGYRLHYRHGSEPCQECKTANTEYQRQRRAESA